MHNAGAVPQPDVFFRKAREPDSLLAGNKVNVDCVGGAGKIFLEIVR
jgi:hypothetical protein